VGNEPGNSEVTDEELGEEIVLLGEVMTAAAGARRHLSREEVDSALGLAADRSSVAPSAPRRCCASRRATSPMS
jgi:hypothetical protein